MPGSRGLQQREVPAVAARTAVIIGSAVLMRVKFNRAVDLQRREIDQHQQYEQRPQQPLQTCLPQSELAKNTHDSAGDDPITFTF